MKQSHLSYLVLSILLFCISSYATIDFPLSDPLDSDPQTKFNEFLREKQFGVLDVKTGVWFFMLPVTRSNDMINNLAYGLERFKIYAQREGKSPQQLSLDIGINSFVYGQLEMKRVTFLSYFSSDTYMQFRILQRQLEKVENANKIDLDLYLD